MGTLGEIKRMAGSIKTNPCPRLLDQDGISPMDAAAKRAVPSSPVLSAPTPAYVEQAFRRYLECVILSHGFARARCDECKHEFLIAFSCKGRGVYTFCNTRRMVETAAYLTDHVFPHNSYLCQKMFFRSKIEQIGRCKPSSGIGT